MILALLGALVVGLSLGVFGSGGSILTVPVLLYILHHDDKVAIAESLGIVGGIAAISAVPYAMSKLIEWRSVVLFGAPAMVGTVVGASLAAHVTGAVQLLVFAGVMMVAALKMWRRGTRAPTASDEQGAAASPARRPWLRICGDGLFVGVLTGFVGVGGGFLIVPALVLLGGLPMRRAVGTSLAIIALKSATGFWKYLGVLEAGGLEVDWASIGLFILVGAVGSFIGRAVNAKINQDALKRGFAVFLVLMGVFILAREGAELLGLIGGGAV